MCGIAGYFGLDPVPDARLERCLGLMRRRGPDHAGHRTWRNAEGRSVALLHSRLSIIDADPRSHQPLRRGTKWIVSNGELYNYVELRRELEHRGCRFSTASDTEVLLAGIEAEGRRFLDRCEGMWAFAVYDETDGDLILCRDRFGEKPLYVTRDARGLAFGSEAGFLRAILGRPFRINEAQILRYLVNGYKSLYKDGETFYREIQEIPAGSWVRIGRDGQETIQRYWEFRPDVDPGMSRDDAVRGAREHLIRSVGIRLRADVPLAFCLSGGVDSNALAGIARKEFSYDVHGFTVVNSDPRYAEQEMVQASVQALRLRHTELHVGTEGFLEALREQVGYHAAPVYTIAHYAHWLLMRQIREHGYRVAVSGTGADELFAGYYDHHLAYLFEVREDPECFAASRRAWLEHIRPLVRNPLLQDPDVFLKNPSARDHIYLNAEEFAGRLTRPWSEPFAERTYSDRLLRNRMLNELFHESVPVILHEEDLNAMYFSVENRSPFLDRGLFEFCSRIPTRHLIRDALGKSVLRDAVRDFVPGPVLENRRKVGFNVPILSLLDVRNPEIRSALLEPSAIFDFLRRESIEALLERSELPNSESKFLFYFLSVKMFLEANRS
jgi:asparagine synthase (glutamine-hydrolysing)